MIEIGTKVKLKYSNKSECLDDFWFEELHEVTQIANEDMPVRYYISGLYFFEDELEVYTPEEFPEYYI